MNFKEFLQFDEVGTSSSCVASFSRPILPTMRRVYPNQIGKKKKSKLDEGVEDTKKRNDWLKMLQQFSNNAATNMRNNSNPSGSQISKEFQKMAGNYGNIQQSWNNVDRLAQTNKQNNNNQKNDPNDMSDNPLIKGITNFGDWMKNIIGNRGSLTQNNSV